MARTDFYPLTVAAVEPLGRRFLASVSGIAEFLAAGAALSPDAPALTFLRSAQDPAPVRVSFASSAAATPKSTSLTWKAPVLSGPLPARITLDGLTSR